MYSEQQAKNGFKTFVVTLSVSLLLFGALYYVITDFSNEIDIEDSASANSTETISYSPPEVRGASDYSVFGGISDDVIEANPQTGVVLGGEVLAGADEEAEESTEATVPDTGSEQVIGMVLAVGFFSAAAYVLLVGPRKLALAGFEKDMLKLGDDSEG